MSKKEQRVWQYLLANRNAEFAEVAEACEVDIAFVKSLVNRIGSDNWRESVEWSKTLNYYTRSDILDTAKKYVTEDRAADHGNMEDNFRTIASYWNTHLGIDFIEPQDVAVMMTMLKLARIKSNNKHIDNWVDACGYMACGGEIVGT